MASQNILHWRDGRGWLVLAGGETGDIRGQVIGRAAADGGVAYLSLGNHGGWIEAALADMDDLGAPPGYIVDALTEDDETLAARLSEAAIIVVENAPEVGELRSGLLGAADVGMQAAFENGAIVLAEGKAAMALGAWVISGDTVLPGLEWLAGALVVPGVMAVAQSAPAQRVLNEQPGAIAIGIGGTSALALGPDGEVEPWGQRQVTVVLGREFGKGG